MLHKVTNIKNSIIHMLNNKQQTEKELEWFLNEIEPLDSNVPHDPFEELQQDVINHLEELRDLLDHKISTMKMRNKNIY